MNDSQANTVAPTSLAVVLFSAGGWRFGIEARHVRASLPAGSAAAAQAAETLLGFASAPGVTQSRHCLCIKLADGDQEIHVDGPVELIDLPATAIHPLPRLLAERVQLRGLQALVMPGETNGQAISLLVDAAVFSPSRPPGDR